tara:strand:+ start:2862 stop:3731 length:870 start_codon:yes stop_codon:yes gene_type:complete
MSVKIECLCIIGLGLIGGSLAAALRSKNPELKLIAIDRDSETLRSAKSSGLIDGGYSSVTELSDIPQVVVVAVPVSAMRSVFVAIKPWFQHCLAITDVGSTKQSVLDDLASVLSPEQSGCFVPGHPIAGREQSGLAAALSDLFQGRRVILTPTEKTRSKSTAIVSQLWQQVGAEVEELSPRDHDEILAATSHLPHALAFSLVRCLTQKHDGEEIFRYAAGGFADFSRIASSDPALWRGICLANQDALLRAINLFEVQLGELKLNLEKADGDALEAMFHVAKTARDQYPG